MVKINAARLLLFTLFSLFLIPSSARSQDMTPEGLKFWKSFTMSMEVSDDKEMKRLVRKHRDHVSAVFDSLITRLCAEDTPANVDNVRTLSEVADGALKSKRYTYRFQFIYNLSPEERYEVAVAGNNYYYGFVAMTEGKETKNVFKLDEAIKLLEKAQAEFDRLGDVEKYLELTMRIGECHDCLEDPYMACVYYQKYEDKKGELPYGGINAEWLDHRLTFLKSKGYDPTLPRDEGGEPSPEALAGAEEGGEGEAGGPKLKFPTFEMGDNAQNVELKFNFMKNPHEFITPAFDSGYNPYTWLKVSFDAREAEAVRYVPFGLGWSREFGNAYPLDFYGKQVNLAKVKNKYYCDIAGNEKSRAVVKATTKPSRVLLEDKENKGPDGKPYKYAFFVAAPGSQEGMFGMEMNNASTRMDWLIVRSRSASYTKGKVFDENFVVIDDNSTGSFGDAKLVESDFITLGEYSYWRTDAIMVGKEKIARPYSRYIKMGEKWINLNLDIYGQKLTASEVTVDTGFVKLDWTGDMEPTYLVLRLVDANNPDVFFNVAGSKDPVEIPIGEYEIAWGKIEDMKKGQSRQIRIYHGKADYLQVFKGEETVLALGAPFTFEFNTSATMDTFKVLGKSITVWGKSKELYTVFFDQVPQPLVSLREAEGQKVVAKKQKMKMPVREDYFADPSSVWFPLDFIYESKKGSKLEAMIEAKNIKFLGGPVTSEWK